MSAPRPFDPARTDRILNRLRVIGAHDFAVRLAASHYLTVEDVVGLCRSPRVYRARAELWTIVKDTFGLSSVEAAAFFDTDHTCILHAERRYHGEIRPLPLVYTRPAPALPPAAEAIA